MVLQQLLLPPLLDLKFKTYLLYFSRTILHLQSIVAISNNNITNHNYHFQLRTCIVFSLSKTCTHLKNNIDHKTQLTGNTLPTMSERN